MKVKTLKIFSIVFLLLLSLMSLGNVNISSAFAETSANPVLIETLDTVNMMDSEKQNKISEIDAGVQLYASLDSTGDFIVQFGNEKGIITSTQSIKQLDFSGIVPVYESIGEIQLPENAVVQMEGTAGQVAILSSLLLTYFKEDANKYYVTIGNNVGSIDKTVINQTSSDAVNAVSSTEVSSNTIPTIQASSTKTLPASFTGKEKYFEVTTRTAVYVKKDSSLVRVGAVNAGAVYPITSYDSPTWLKVNFGGSVGYVRQEYAKPASTITNLIGSYVNSSIKFAPKLNIAVYEKTANGLQQIGSINQNIKYPMVSDIGSWYRINFAGKLAFVKESNVNLVEASSASKTAFTTSDKYFKVTTRTAIYVKKDGALVKSGAVDANQVYPRIADAGGYHQVKFGNGIGYVKKEYTAPVGTVSISNLNTSYKNSSYTFAPINNIAVYEKTASGLKQFGSIYKNISYPMISDIGDWLKVDLAGRVGYVREKDVKLQFNSTIKYFEVVSRTAIYQKQGSSLVRVGAVDGGQIFPRIGDYGPNYHQVKYGNTTGLVRVEYTKPAIGSAIQNLNKSYTNSSNSFTPTVNISVYEKTSTGLKQFGSLYANYRYPLIKDNGDWYIIDLAGRIGYVKESFVADTFSSTNHYFKTLTERPVYNDANKTDVIGYLRSGQAFQWLSGSTTFLHKIKFGTGYGYVERTLTDPHTGMGIKNLSIGEANSGRFFVLKNAAVYDTSSGSSVAFATLPAKTYYPFISTTGGWFKVNVGGRIGYISSSAVEVSSNYNYINYNYTLQDMYAIQNTLSTKPQTDYKYGSYYVSKDYVTVTSTSPWKGKVTASSLNVRLKPDANSWSFGTLSLNSIVTITGESGNWYKINYTGNLGWVNATPEDTMRKMDPNNFISDPKAIFQFLKLSTVVGMASDDINSLMLNGKGILEGKGSAFVTAALKYNINEVYLVNHALLETGAGTAYQSKLASGILVSSVDGVAVTPKVVYNMYGINAFDSNPTKEGSEFAYKQGWFTPDAAIIGGAEFIASRYIYNSSYRQDTLYKMRWNPEKTGNHQYATDIGWAEKQAERYYAILKDYPVVFDIPVFMKN
jgi:mannosyl-glycoprotein endo-beta-N-acetylglucosaminidase